MSARDIMLDRIRKALGRRPAVTTGSPCGIDLPPLEEVMPPIPRDELVPKFEAELTKVGGNVYRAASREELDRTIQGILESSQARSAILTRNPILVQLGMEQRLRAWGIVATVWAGETASAAGNRAPTRNEFAPASFDAGVGLSGVEFALAETGSLVLTSRTEGSQLASLAPPVHLAIYRRGQVLGSLDEVLERLPIALDPNSGRSVVFVTGPSRTADIEQILVRGVHGPRELHAILVEESCFA